MKTPQEIIQEILITEKGTDLQARNNQYLFKVDTRANKIEVRQAVEQMFKVQVDKVNIVNVMGKRRRVRWQYGYTPSWKKAIVTLKEGQSIDLA